MMSQTVIGYTNWQQPDHDSMPGVRTIAVSAPKRKSARQHKPAPQRAVPPDAHGFVESDGVIAIEAAHHSRAVGAHSIVWRTIPNLGRTDSAVTAFPVTFPPQQPGDGPYLEYPIWLREAGDVQIQVVLSPTLDFGNRGLRYAISVDDERPQLVDVNGEVGQREWEQAVAQNAWLRATRHQVSRAGAHVVRL